MRIIKQHDENDCGAACLASIARYYGYKEELARIREITKTDRMGCNIYGLVDGAEKIGLKAEALQGSFDELKTESEKEGVLPAIALIRTEDSLMHFVVVISIGKKIKIGDPAKGIRKMSIEEFNERWTGYLVLFDKSDNFEKKKKKNDLRNVIKLLRGDVKKLVVVFCLSLIIAAIGIGGTFVFKVVIDGINNEQHVESGEHKHEKEHEHEHDEHSEGKEEKLFADKVIDAIGEANTPEKIGIIFSALIGLYLLQGLIQFLRGVLIVSFSRNVDKKLCVSYYNHIIDLPLESISLRQTGEYLSRFSETYQIREAISESTVTLCLDTLMVIGCGILLFMLNTYLFLVSLIVVLIYAIVALAFRRPVEKSSRKVMEKDANLQSYMKESIDGVETVKAMNADQKVKKKNFGIFNSFINAVFKNNVISMTQDTIVTVVEAIGIIIVLWIGFVLALNNVLSIGMLITYYALLAYFTGPIKNLIKLQPNIQKAIVAADRLKDIYLLKREESEGKLELNSVDDISINNVDFRYGNRELSLKNISMEIPKGSKIAIVGESGSGKTTLAKMLMNFMQPEKGSISINDKNIQEYKLDSLRKSISYIGQSTFLFSDTIENNLKIANPDATQKEIENACDKAGVDSFIKDSPYSYDLVLEENGANLSGGERQRIAIARALLRKPELLIMDEATSNLDTITESAIYNTVFDTNNNNTHIIIAHRLSTIKKCDCIYVMDKGSIVESGKHEELLEKKGKYYNLVKGLSLE